MSGVRLIPLGILVLLAACQWPLPAPSTLQRQDGGGDSTPGGARFFRATSLWNTSIASQPVTWADQAGMRSASWGVQTSCAVVLGSSSDPVVDVAVESSWGWPAGVVKAHVPRGVTTHPGASESLVVIDGSTAYDFFEFIRDSDTKARASAWAQSDIVTGSGWGSSSPFRGAGTRGAGSSGLAGEIYGTELTQGIHHALAFGSAPAAGLDGPSRPPAISGDGPAEGTRVGIPPGTAKPGNLSVQGSSAWDALEKYGAWLVGRVDGPSPAVFSVDPRSVSQSDIDALLDDLDKITPALRVVVYSYPYDP